MMKYTIKLGCMKLNNYKTIAESYTGEIIEKKSRFIAYMSPVTTEDAALDFIGKISKKHWDATHNVYAYKIRDNNISRCSDDGEPAKTAGAPVLDVIEKEGLTDIVIVVTRYFGGTLLGTGGLVKAYSGAAKAVISNADIVTMQTSVKFVLSIPYTFLGKYENEFIKYGVLILEKEFSENVDILGVCKEEDFTVINKKFSEISNGKYLIEPIEKLFYGFKE
ncbi:MAG: YigZ family protein [Ruminococcaceae bacterium]|nr:YigZ family protein [Oscillospiraceae bacterium]